ncbi:MAG: SPOR domain-containing protein [Betaproteobacteria bacterium]|jgi:septal ring-binding cell division protein DamX|nr:SPOR domain-containing protein [Betaproteobacteria bacterium]NBP43605.1 SPOR domain-containing protein [Betaproteobacteria bacterium]
MNQFYQSPADKMRLEVLLKSLLEGRLNLAILGHDEVALAHYARQIHEHLKDNGQRVELWSSAESEQLVGRFNQILAELTLKQAQDKLMTSADRLYLIFPDTHSIADFELQLLARLVNGFPASNINVILLINRLEPFEKKLQAFGKNLLQWVLESEHPIPDRPTQIEVKSEEPSSPAPRAPELQELNATVQANEAPFAPDSSPARKLASQRRGKGLGLVILALLLSGAAFAAMKWWSSARSAQGAEPAPTAAATSAAPTEDKPPTSEAATSSEATSAASAVGMSSTSNQPVPAQESLTSGKEELVAPTPAPVAPVQATASTPATPPAAPVAATPPAPSSATAAANKGETAKLQTDHEWVQQLKTGQWVLQLAALASQQEASTVADALPTKEKVRILMAPKNGNNKYYYIVISGPYDSKEAAEVIMKSSPAFSKAWMRSAKSMKSQFDKP